MRDFQGDFEVHLTVRAVNAAELVDFQTWCAARQLKFLRIELARGAHAEQPMASWRSRATKLPVVHQLALQQAEEITQRGLAVIRLKIEAAPANADVPQNDQDAAALDRSTECHPYFEHHLKLLRDVDRSREQLLAVCHGHVAHLSRNALRPARDGKEERFVTLRSYGMGRGRSDLAFHALRDALLASGETILECESEYCVLTRTWR